MRNGAVQLNIRQIQEWGRYHRLLHGQWPRRDSGALYGQPGVYWSLVDRCLRHGGCGLRGGTTLSLLMRKTSDGELHHGPHKRSLTVRQVLEWADQFHMRTGKWPTTASGRVAEAPDIKWSTVHQRLKRGDVEPARKTTLVRLLREQRGVWDSRQRARLTYPLILKWADAHYAHTGRWPVTLSGPVHGQPGEIWATIDMAMRNGRRGLSGTMSLSQLLQRERHELYHPTHPRISVQRVLECADLHHMRTGRWPSRKAGNVPHLPGVTWSQIDIWVARGKNGLPGGSSLSQLLKKHGRGRPLSTAGVQ